MSPENYTHLTRDDVLNLARMAGLPIEDSEVDEIRFRLNALMEALGQLDSQDLAGVDPLPLLGQTEERRDG